LATASAQVCVPLGHSSLYFYHESWRNDICSFRAMTLALIVSFKLISF